jgi:23S rRNA (cytidine2498-2'-O)-methyltransferase
VNKFPIRSCYLAIPGFEDQLKNCLQGETVAHGRLLLNSLPADNNIVWTHNIWQNPVLQSFDSITNASKILRGIQRNWAPYEETCFRRMALIQEKLPKISLGPQAFPLETPKDRLGSWTLLEPDLLLFSSNCTSKFANGEIEFIEDKVGPPNRAYLKLWEALAHFEALPTSTDTCLELGASPGGWTWVLGQFAGKVLAVDRSPLDPSVAALKPVQFIKGNAFTCTPAEYPQVNWLISDVICYPEKLYEFLQIWLESPILTHMILTIKFQGTENYGILEKFRQVPGSSIRHLRSNKHEVTFFWKRPNSPT